MISRPKTIEKNLSQLIKEADEVFSVFIRRRDLPGGVGKCFICGNKLFHSQAHCGHYIDRDQMPTRYDEMNANAICQTCNCFEAEHKEQYALKMILIHGHHDLYQLEAKARGLQKYMRHELVELIEYYKSENRLRK